MIGVLALQGGVLEHIEMLKKANKKLGLKDEVALVRTVGDLAGIVGLIIPGGESTVLQTLLEREKMYEAIKKVPNIFGTCAGAIMLAKQIVNAAPSQKTLELMDVTAVRNAYGQQIESFEDDIKTELGNVHVIFIRAPQLKNVGANVKILAKRKNEIIACEETVGNNFYLATTFHPELSTTVFHEYFIKRVIKL